MLWVYFQIRPRIAKHLSFLSRVRLGCHHFQNNVCWKLVTLLFFFIKLGNWLHGYKSPWSAMSRLGFRPILLKRNEIYFVYQVPIITPPTTSNWVCYIKMADQGIEILIIQDSDLELRTQKYFQFSVYTPSWGSPMLHFQRKLSSHSCLVP